MCEESGEHKRYVGRQITKHDLWESTIKSVVYRNQDSERAVRNFKTEQPLSYAYNGSGDGGKEGVPLEVLYDAILCKNRPGRISKWNTIHLLKVSGESSVM